MADGRHSYQHELAEVGRGNGPLCVRSQCCPLLGLPDLWRHRGKSNGGGGGNWSKLYDSVCAAKGSGGRLAWMGVCGSSSAVAPREKSKFVRPHHLEVYSSLHIRMRTAYCVPSFATITLRRRPLCRANRPSGPWTRCGRAMMAATRTETRNRARSPATLSTREAQRGQPYLRQLGAGMG